MKQNETYNSDILDELLDEISPSELKKTEKRMLLAKRIAEGMQAKNWRKTDLAKAMKKQPSVITKWLSGTHNFSIDTLFDLEETLGIKLINTEESPVQTVASFHISLSQNQSCVNTEDNKEISIMPASNVFITSSRLEVN